MNTEAVERFFGWIAERHRIYQARAAGNPAPWTNDPIFNEYKFTNPFRENDRVTIWMRENWTSVNDHRPPEEIFFNCCLFRMVGTSEFAQEHGWVTEWEPHQTKWLIQDRLEKKQRTFTGAYIITNQGIKAPKSLIVVDMFLSPVWEARKELAAAAKETNSLKETHKALSKYRGWGGGGFMAYEVVTDLNYTSVLPDPVDKNLWANAGPGAKRGLNRIYDRELKKNLRPSIANHEMRTLLAQASEYFLDIENFPVSELDMRTIEHSLCEWDKYERIRLGQGRPRSRFSADLGRTSVRGAVG
tara:strand:+ start:8736 stop:9638 length:903 start_codon:yes stop_codon:yes gene_type:complete